MSKKFNAAGLLVKFGQSVLLGRRSSACANLSGYWSMPCGAMDNGEEPIDTARREFFEETGNAINEQIKFLTSFKMKNDGEFNVFYAESPQLIFPSERALDSIEHDEWGYYRISNKSLPCPMTKETKKAILMLE